MNYLFFVAGSILGFLVAILALSLCRSARIAELEAQVDYWRMVAEDVVGIKKLKNSKKV